MSWCLRCSSHRTEGYSEQFLGKYYYLHFYKLVQCICINGSCLLFLQKSLKQKFKTKGFKCQHFNHFSLTMTGVWNVSNKKRLMALQSIYWSPNIYIHSIINNNAFLAEFHFDKLMTIKNLIKLWCTVDISLTPKSSYAISYSTILSLINTNIDFIKSVLKTNDKPINLGFV